MSKYYNVKIDSGTAPGPYTIYYGSINSSNIATLYVDGNPATNVTKVSLNSGDGVLVIVPDNTTRVILYNQECDTYEDNLVTYTITAGSSNVNEGESITLNVTTKNVPNNTVLYWKINYNNSSSDPDFFTAVTGTTTIVNKVSTFSVSLESDLTTEGSETFYVELITGSITGDIVDNTDIITINDTSRLYYYLVRDTYNCESYGSPTAYYKVNTDYGNNKLVKVNGVGDNKWLERNELSQNDGDSAAFVDVTNCVQGTPTYSITEPSSVVSEGDTVTFTINTTYVRDGTILYWKVNTNDSSQNASENDDFSFISGSTAINNNIGNTTYTVIRNDTTTEGSETFYLELRTTSINGPLVDTTGVITITDTSTSAPTYSFSSTPSSVDEGSSTNFTVTTTDVPNGTTLYWTIDYNSSSDSTDFTSTSGSFTINNNSGVIGVSIANDYKTEGSQTFKVQLRTVSTSGTIVKTSDEVTINDTSTYPGVSFTYLQTCNGTSNASGRVTFTDVTGGDSGPYKVTINGTDWSTWTGGSFRIDNIGDGNYNLRARDFSENYSSISTITVDCYRAPTYSISPSTLTINEPGSVTFTVTTQYVPNGTTLYWTTEHEIGSSSPTDFSPSIGTVTIQNNTSTFNVGILADNFTDGTETFKVRLRTGSLSGNIVATSQTVTIYDTSKNTVPNWEYQNYTTCSGCENVAVYKDTNPNSTTNGYYKIGTGGNPQLNQPSGGICNTNAVWENNGSYGCYGTCGKYYTQTDSNPCSITSQSTRQGDLVPGEGNSTFCYNGSNCCGQSTTPVYSVYVSERCDENTGIIYETYSNSNPCASYAGTQERASDRRCAAWASAGSFHYTCADAIAGTYNTDPQNGLVQPFTIVGRNGEYRFDDSNGAPANGTFYDGGVTDSSSPYYPRPHYFSNGSLTISDFGCTP